jgi:putative ABC transport system permease protein
MQLRTRQRDAFTAVNSRSATSRARARAHEPLLVLQVALTLALVIGSGLLFKSLYRLLEVAPGFDASNVMTTMLSLPSGKHAWSYNSRFIERVIDRVRDLDVIEAAGAIRGIPMKSVPFDAVFWRWDKPVTNSQGNLATIRVISEEYFHAMGIPVVAGRDFVRQDGVGEVGKTNAVIVNQTLDCCIRSFDADPGGRDPNRRRRDAA